jgi:hypothetical protein
MSNTQWPFGPVPPGHLPWTIVDVDGPASYSAISAATPPTGGQVLKAADLGFQQIWWAQCVGSDNGQYDGVVYVVGGLGNPRSGATPNVSQAGSQINLQWITAATGAEVGGATNLSARRLRLLVIGQ